MRKHRAFLFVAGVGTAFTAGLFVLFRQAPMMPLAASAEAARVDGAFEFILRLVVPIYAYLMAALVYALIFFRAKKPGEEGEKFDRSRGRWVEFLWIGLSLILTIGLAIYGSIELRHLLSGQDRADLRVEVKAAQFSWEFYYPDADQYGSRLTLPVGRSVRLILHSEDVLHSFWVPEFRLKQDVVPGITTQLVVTPTVKGTYQLQCSELCGYGHTEMTAWVDVVDPETFDEILKAEEW